MGSRPGRKQISLCSTTAMHDHSKSFAAHDQQVHDAWKALGGWVTKHKPKFGPVTAEYFKGASQVTDEEVGHCQAMSSGCSAHSACSRALFTDASSTNHLHMLRAAVQPALCDWKASSLLQSIILQHGHPCTA